MHNNICLNMNEFFDMMESFIKKEDVIYSKTIALIVSSLIKERQRLRLNQSEFAKLLNVKQSVISRWEGGDSNFTIKTLSKIAASLNFDLYVNLIPHKDIEVEINKNNCRAISHSYQSYKKMDEKKYELKQCYVQRKYYTNWKELIIK